MLHAPMETQPWDYGPWKHRTPSHDGMFHAQLFQAGTRGAAFHPDFTVELNWPRYAQRISTTDEVVSALADVK
ncbi:MAG: hypothetical protein FWE15_18535 [Actinomycetia bacterium]|nr:hypothetical protein [Actinomycetes bacterium]